jgi:hypothetical protein
MDDPVKHEFMSIVDGPVGRTVGAERRRRVLASDASSYDRLDRDDRRRLDSAIVKNLLGRRASFDYVKRRPL